MKVVIVKLEKGGCEIESFCNWKLPSQHKQLSFKLSKVNTHPRKYALKRRENYNFAVKLLNQFYAGTEQF